MVYISIKQAQHGDAVCPLYVQEVLEDEEGLCSLCGLPLEADGQQIVIKAHEIGFLNGYDSAIHQDWK